MFRFLNRIDFLPLKHLIENKQFETEGYLCPKPDLRKKSLWGTQRWPYGSSCQSREFGFEFGYTFAIVGLYFVFVYISFLFTFYLHFIFVYILFLFIFHFCLHFVFICLHLVFVKKGHHLHVHLHVQRKIYNINIMVHVEIHLSKLNQ